MDGVDAQTRSAPGEGGDEGVDPAEAFTVDDFGELGLSPGAEVGVGVAMNGGTSDFAIFRDAGVPFMMFFGSDTSRIHTERDLLEFVQPEMLGGAAATAAVLLRPQEFADLIANK